MNLSLKNKTALVGGASQGIGEAVAIELALLGANIICLSRSLEKLNKVCQSLEHSNGQKHCVIALDVSDRNNLEQEIKKKIEEYNGIDILINNTGGPKSGAITQATDQDFIEGMNQHLLVNSLLAKLALPKMKEKKFGRIINITSTSVRTPIANLGVSTSVRWAVTAWAKTLAMEVAPWEITVNSVLPGMTLTPRLEALKKAAALRDNCSEIQVADKWLESIPQRRFAAPNEVASAVAFLATPAAAYINGVVLPVDGGRTL